MLIEANDKKILVDPMLGAVGSLPPLAVFRFKARRNPLVPIPIESKSVLEAVTHCLITHLHPDHLDREAVRFLRERQIPVVCSIKDVGALKKKGQNIFQTIDYWTRVEFLGGIIEGIPARHGYGFVAKLMGNVMGYYIELPNQPSIYLSSDTIYTENVDKVLKVYKPSISIVASGAAQFDLFKPLFMTMEEILHFTRNAPHKVMMNHLEAVNHCPTTRVGLKQELEKNGLLEKSYIPDDGEWIEIN